MMLSDQEKIRYSRHLSLPNFGPEAQQRLKEARVLVVGTGGLGAPMLQYLTAAGVGTIGVMDFDTVDDTNLQRQVLFDTEDVGMHKTSTAIARLEKQNPFVNFIEYNHQLTSANALDIIREYEVVADGTDNFPTRYLVNDACVLTGKTNVYASIFQYEGQVSVFNYKNGSGDYGPNYRDLYPTPPPPGMVPSCAEGGVIGVLPGIIGSIQALEVIKVLSGIGEPLSGRLFLFDGLDFGSRVMNVRKDPANPLTGDNPTIHELINYEEFCGMNNNVNEIRQIDVQQLNQWQEDNVEFALIDVREPHEYEAANIGGECIPMGEVEKHLDKIPRDIPCVMLCKAGMRSEFVIQKLQSEHEYSNLFNLRNGILAWKRTFDPTMAVI